jgi:hypothetical protein
MTTKPERPDAAGLFDDLDDLDLDSYYQPDEDAHPSEYLAPPRGRPMTTQPTRDGNDAPRPRLRPEFRVRAILSSQRVLVVGCDTLGDAMILAGSFDPSGTIQQRMVGPWSPVTAKPVRPRQPVTENVDPDPGADSTQAGD